MTADPNRTLGDEALFARFLAAHIMEHAIAAGNEDVGNDLLVGRVGFRRGAGEEVIVSRAPGWRRDSAAARSSGRRNCRAGRKRLRLTTSTFS